MQQKSSPHANTHTRVVFRLGVQIVCALCFTFFLAVSSKAQELEPRAYSPAPLGLNFLVLSYAYQFGEVLFDPTVPFDDVSAKLNASAIAYGRTFNLGGRSASVLAAFPYVWGRVSGTLQEQQQSVTRSGNADSRFRLAVNILGGPALKPREFAARKQTTTLGASVTVIAPTGQYDPVKLINIGTNRWAFKPEVGLAKPIGNWSVEFYGGVWLFTDNNDFFGGQKREQQPMASFQTHVSYTFKPRLWVSGDATYFTGGRTTINGIPRADLQRNTRIGVTASFPLTKQSAMKATWARGVITRIGGDFNTFGVTWQYTWFD